MDWFILRTAGRSTLVLAKTLAEDGFDVWTPARIERIRNPARNVKRDVRVPLLPSFVFVRVRHLPDLLELAQMEEKPRRCPIDNGHSRPAHRDFSVFRNHDGIPLIEDAELEPLRMKELAATPKTHRFDKGTRVKVHGGVFGGLRGKVERHKSGHVVVIFDDWRRPAKIPAWLLKEDDIESGHHAAKAA